MASSERRSSDPSTPPSRMTFDRLLRSFITSAPLPESAPAADPPPAALRLAETVSGDAWKVCKVEVPDEEMMTLEDFLARAGASVRDDDGGGDDDKAEETEIEVEDVKPMQTVPPLLLPPAHQLSGGMLAFDAKVEPSVVGFGNGAEVIGGGGVGLRGKRTVSLLEPLDKAAEQRQRRMIKNRESAARSRERKQAYQVELESLAVKLEEENELLMKEKAERTKERHKQLLQRVVPVIEKPKLPRTLRRVRSMQW